ncbi:MAG TPA: hypothetical protein VEX70_01165 [Pyrinomonadaceae bacterium]|nr:hypothetical protein [Pyrinomonadaceae bacterium]
MNSLVRQCEGKNVNEGKSLLPLTGSCRISVGSLSGDGRCLVLEVTQRKAGDDDVTTVLLSSDKARELIEALSQHAGGLNARR